MTKEHLATIFICSVVFVGCGIIRGVPKYVFADGYYSSKSRKSGHAKYYVNNANDTIYVYKIKKENNSFVTDTLTHKASLFPESSPKFVSDDRYFRQSSFDVDFLTIPFKYRPPVNNFPSQFTTNLNGAVYLGYRNDIYSLGYHKNPLNIYRRKIMHYGYSMGIVTGFGATAMNPWVTENKISIEYEGMVWSKGLAAIIGINNFTIGLALGWDTLLDKNKTVWIYQSKPWLGLAFGLNLN
jgi:hypothetical protein